MPRSCRSASDRGELGLAPWRKAEVAGSRRSDPVRRVLTAQWSRLPASRQAQSGRDDDERAVGPIRAPRDHAIRARLRRCPVEAGRIDGTSGGRPFNRRRADCAVRQAVQRDEIHGVARLHGDRVGGDMDDTRRSRTCRTFGRTFGGGRVVAVNARRFGAGTGKSTKNESSGRGEAAKSESRHGQSFPRKLVNGGPDQPAEQRNPGAYCRSR